METEMNAKQIVIAKLRQRGIDAVESKSGIYAMLIDGEPIETVSFTFAGYMPRSYMGHVYIQVERPQPDEYRADSKSFQLMNDSNVDAAVDAIIDHVKATGGKKMNLPLHPIDVE
jgi:hypothetical protein